MHKTTHKFNKAGVLILAGLSLCTTSCKQQPEQKPNIIFLLTDDHRYDALGVMGDPILQTPYLDKLAKDGFLFKNAYVTTSICCCSRASFLSGQYTSRHGINSFHHSFSPEAVQYTYPLLLKNKAGYSIGFIGKYGVGLDYPDKYYDYWAVEDKHQPDYENYDINGNIIHHNDLVTQQILEFLDLYGNSNQPFCLSVSYKAPHVQDGDPRQFIIQQRFSELYADDTIPLPFTYDSAYYYKKFPRDFRHPVPSETHIENEARRRWRKRFSDPENYQKSVKNHHRLLTGVDESAGQMIKTLQKMGIDDNTIIIFAGDNGFYLAEHGLAGKWYGHEESVRIPFFIYDPRAPKEKRGVSIDKMVLNIDVAPTILSLAGIEIPETMQGKDITPLFGNNHIPWRTEFFYEHTIHIPTIPKSIGVIHKDYTYLVYPELQSGFEEFYDMKKDPFQTNNLINDSDYHDIIEDFRRRTEEWAKIVK
jgi:arylsulfatase A-like enzyme